MKQLVTYWVWVRLFVLLPFVFSGCTDNGVQLPARFEAGLTLVALSDDGDLIDAVPIPSDDSVTSVVFQLPDNLESMQLVLWGDRIHDSIPKGAYFTTSRKGLAEIQVSIVDGIAESVVGNGYGTPFKMPSNLVEQVQRHLDGERSPIESTKIERQ
jgi:hypothetical protein